MPLKRKDNFEQKKKSAFQEWECEQYESGKPYDRFVGRKEGWNAFADALHEWIEKDEIQINAAGIMQKIKEMMED